MCGMERQRERGACTAMLRAGMDVGLTLVDRREKEKIEVPHSFYI